MTAKWDQILAMMAALGGPVHGIGNRGRRGPTPSRSQRRHYKNPASTVGQVNVDKQYSAWSAGHPQRRAEAMIKATRLSVSKELRHRIAQREGRGYSGSMPQSIGSHPGSGLTKWS